MTDPKRLSTEGSKLERSLLSSVRDDAPTSEAERAARAALGLPLAAPPPPAAHTGAATSGASASGATAAASATVKWAIGLTVAAATAGVVAINATRDEPKSDAKQSPAILQNRPQPVPEPVPEEAAKDPQRAAPVEVEPPVRQPQPTPAISRPTPTPKARAKELAKTKPQSTLAEELRLIDSARSALSKGDFDEAEKLLGAYFSKFESGSLVEEARVVQIEVVVQQKDETRAHELAERFSRSHPDSPLLERVRRLVGTLKAP